MQGVIHAVEVIEQSGHRRKLDDLSLVIVLAQTLEHRIIDFMRVERELPRVRKRRFFFFVERSVLEIDQGLQLLLRRPMTRSLRGVGAVSILAAVDARDERGHELLRADGDRAGVGDGVEVRQHGF